MRLSPSATLPAVLAVCLLFCLPAHGKTAMNKRARDLSALLVAPRMSKKPKGSDFEKTAARLVNIISALDDSYRSNGPDPDDLLTTAFSFREDVGDYERMVTSRALVDAWQMARNLGLFDKEGIFQSEISLGSEKGQMAVIEYIVPPSVQPEFSAHHANLRIVPPNQQRQSDELNDAEKAIQDQLVATMDERRKLAALHAIENPPELNEVGRTPDQEKAYWKQKVAEAGDNFEKEPKIILEARVTATPSHMSKNRWRVTAEITNLSHHPTEVTLEYHLLGISAKKNQHFILKTDRPTVQLLNGQEKGIDLWTAASSKYKDKVIMIDGLTGKEAKNPKYSFRGYAIRVEHEGKTVATYASDRRLMSYLEEDNDGVKLSSLP